MKEVNFYRGKESSYNINPDKYKDGIYFATDKRKIIVNGDSYGSVDVDNKLTAGSTNPVTSAAISAAIPERVQAALKESNFITGVTIANTGGNLYEISTIDAKGNYKSVGTILGELDATANVDKVLFYEITGVTNKQFISEDEITFTFKYDYLNSNNQSYFYDAIVRLYDSNNNLISENNCGAGLQIRLLIPQTENMVGTASVFTVTATPVDNSGVELTEKTESRNVRVTIIDFVMHLSGYNLDNIYSFGDTIQLTFDFEGYLGTRDLTLYVDNDTTPYQSQVLSEGISGYTFSIPVNTTTFAPEVLQHNILAVSHYKTTQGDDIYSNIIYIAIPIKGDIPSFGTVFNIESSDGKILGVNDLPSITVNQYEAFSFSFNAYSNLGKIVEFYSDNTLISDYSLSGNSTILSYKYNTEGTKICSLECGNQSFKFGVNVLKATLSIQVPSDMSLYLTPLGKSNSSVSRNQWLYKDITSNFEGFNWNTDGWLNVITPEGTEPALRLISGDKVTINYKPFLGGKNATNAFTFMIRFRASSVADESQTLLSCIDDNGTGIKITGTEAYYKNSEGAIISTKFSTDQIYNIGFTVFPNLESNTEANKLNSLLMFLYVDGVMSGNTKSSDTASIYLGINPSNIVLTANSCILDVFSIKCYTYAFSESNMFASYLVDLNNPDLMSSEYLSNLVLESNNVSMEKALECGIPCMLITGEYTDSGNSYNAVDYVAANNSKGPKFDIDEILYLETKEASNKNFISIRKKGSDSIFIGEGGEDYPQLRLLGTSSMNYPIKNFRIYTKNSKLFLNSSIDDLYKSVEDIEKLEAEGVYVKESKPKYALHENSVPVNCWCLKADFAEASSSHNTGFARMVHDLSMSMNSLTPPQSNKAEDYPYEIRTTIDGHPCLLFSRKTTSDIPVFRGKFNFNNDKSTEEVFGFVDIDGYHNNPELESELIAATEKSMPWLLTEDSFTYKEIGEDKKEKVITITKDDIKELLGNNPTECWEFRNNEHPFGDFKDVDFTAFTEIEEKDPDTGEVTIKKTDSLAWLDCWEARFPDEDEINIAFKTGAIRPYYLETLALWIMSTDTTKADSNKVLSSPITYGTVTHTHDTKEYRKDKFINEINQYFNFNFLCEYYVLNDMVAGADQRKKNMMWAFWYNKDVDGSGPMGKMRCYPIYYDNDTILGVDNAGKITIPWDADENTMTDTSYTFAGHNSVIWQNLRNCFPTELKNTYRKIRAIASNDYIKQYFNDKQSNKYGEVVFNKDSIFKYIRTNVIGTAHKPGTSVVPEFAWDPFSDYIQGTRKAHRDWFINKRLDWFDNKYAAGGFEKANLKFKGGIGYVPYYTIKTAKDSYYSFTSDKVTDINRYHTLVKTSTNEYDYNFNLGEVPGPGATYIIYGISNISEFDLSNWSGFNSFIVGAPFTNLKKLVLGSIEFAPIRTSKGITFTSANYPQLEYLDVSNMLGAASDPYTTATLKDLLYLKTFIATGCSNLTTASFAPGGAISRIVLPENFLNLYLVNLPNLSKSGIEWGSCSRPLWEVTVDSEGNTIVTKLDKYEELKASYASIRQLHVENCPNIDGMDLLNTILNTEGSKLNAVRIVGVNLSGNGDDLLNLYNKKINGLLVSSSGSYNVVSNQCTIIGTYKLSRLWNDNERGVKFDDLCAYFPELDIQQPKYTHISFDTLDSTPYKLTNHDNNSGYGCLDTYSPSGYITKILDKRYSCLVKMIDAEHGEVNVQRLTDEDLLSMDPNVMLSGDKGDYCMYEPNYWYKGVNDHMNNKIHLFVSDTNNAPTINKHTVLTESDCVKVIQNKAVSTIKNLLTLVEDTARNVYHFDLTKYRNFKQIRITSTNAANKGSIIITESGNNKRIYAGLAQGMNDQSYLFTSLPNDATDIYITQDKNKIVELRLIESEDIEAVEEGWVKHNECFIGKLLSVVEAGDSVNSVYKPTAYSNCTNVYTKTDNISAITACGYLIGNSNGFHFPMGYEQYKDILLLAYLEYGTTALHLDKVGVGLSNSTNINNTTGFPSYWEPRYISNPDYLKYGNTDTKINPELTNIPYNSCIEQGKSILYPEVSVLMGYYQFIGYSSTISTNDYIDSNGYYIQSLNDKEVRRIKIYNGDLKGHFVGHIIGGKYFDIFGVPNSTTNNITASECFCGYESLGSSGSSGYLSTGYVVKAMSSVITSSHLAIAGLSPVMNVLVYNGERRNMIRVVIAPNKINII